MSEEQAKNETGAFSFAVTLLAAFGTVLYAAYNYLQKTPLDPLWYFFICRLIAVALILVLGLLLYIFIKGYSFEVQDTSQREKLTKWASHLYLGIFFLFIIVLLLTIFGFVFFLVFIVIYPEISPIIFIISVFAVSFILGAVVSFRLFKEIQLRSILIIVFLFVCLLLVPTLSTSVLQSPLQGHVTIDIGDIYYKNGAPIPVLIHVTGPNTGLSIHLLKEESNHDLLSWENITLIPERDSSYKTVSGKYLVGNTLDYGTYNVFINTAELSAGYYELVCIRWGYKTYGKKGFYLLNSS